MVDGRAPKRCTTWAICLPMYTPGTPPSYYTPGTPPSEHHRAGYTSTDARRRASEPWAQGPEAAWVGGFSGNLPVRTVINEGGFSGSLPGSSGRRNGKIG